MSLSDIMSHAGLTRFAEIGLLISFAAFACVVVWALLLPRRQVEAFARQALEDDEPAKPEAERPRADDSTVDAATPSRRENRT